MKKLAIVTTHPIQYNAPWFRLLSTRGKLDVHVFYTWEQSASGATFDHDFKRTVSWDIPLLDGYPYSFVKNVAVDPGVHHFKGIDNPTLITEIKQYNPDAILVIRWSCKSHLQVMRHFRGKIPVLFRGDSTLLDKKPLLKSIARKIFLSWVYSFVDVGLYVGEHSRRYFVAHGLGKRLHYVPHAIDNDRFLANTQTILQAAEWRKKLGIGPSDIVILFAGKLEPKKNPSLLLKAFTRVTATGVKLVIVGNGIEEESLKEKFGSRPDIHFLDFQNQSVMPSVYQICDLFVLPSQGPEETWGLAINEAMACGKAVLVSDKCGGAVDLVIDGNNGYVFESNNETDLTGKMMKMINDPVRLKHMGHASLQRIANFSFMKICSSLEELIQYKL